MERLVRYWVPESTKRAMGFQDEEALLATARFLGGIHDIGKATVVFQANILRALPEARQRLETLTSLDCPVQNSRESPHARAGEAILLREDWSRWDRLHCGGTPRQASELHGGR